MKGAEKIPKKGIHKWKVKINSYPSIMWANIRIGICPKNLSYFNKKPFKYSWDMSAYHAKYFAKDEEKDFSFNKKELDSGDIVGIKFNSSNGELSFSVNDSDYIIVDHLPTNIDLYPCVELSKVGTSVSLL